MFGIILLVGWLLITFIPIIAVSVRRLHDGGRTGWWWWLNLLCFVGPRLAGVLADDQAG